MHIGNINRLFSDKEYGFIKTKSGEEARFNKFCLWGVEFSDLREGQEVEFEIQPSYKGSIAFHIRPHSKSLLV